MNGHIKNPSKSAWTTGTKPPQTTGIPGQKKAHLMKKHVNIGDLKEVKKVGQKNDKQSTANASVGTI